MSFILTEEMIGIVEGILGWNTVLYRKKIRLYTT